MSGRGLSSRLEAMAGELAFKDDLTGLYNRRLLSHLFAHWWAELCSEHGRLALLILDLDGFKEVNDTLGHLAGDSVLRRTAEALRRTFRGSDVLVRYGGDEFVVLLPGAGQAEAATLGTRARDALSALLATLPPEDGAARLSVSFSLGAASYPEDGATGEEILARADERLYIEKRGRSRSRVTSSRRWLPLLAAGGAAAAAVAAALVWLRPSPLPTPPGTPAAAGGFAPASGGPSARELALLKEIALLRQELALREARPAGEIPAEKDQADIQKLRSRILELEVQLADERPQQVGPTPTPLPSPPVSPLAAAPESVPAATGSPAASVPLESEEAAVPSFVPPRLLRYDTPVYPERARQFRRQAVVELRVVVDARGAVKRAWPIGTPIGLGFEEAARRAALTAQYVPAMREGTPVEAETTLTVVFRLDSR